MKKRLYLILAFFSCFLLGCNSTPTRYYQLSLDNQGINPLQNQKDKKIYALRNLEVPEYLDNQYLIYFENCCEINRDSKRLWQDEVKENIRRYLHHRLGGYTYPLPQTLRANIIRDIKITELIANKERGSFYAKAQWEITDLDREKSKTGIFEKSYPLDFQSEGLEERLIKLYKLALDEIAFSMSN